MKAKEKKKGILAGTSLRSTPVGMKPVTANKEVKEERKQGKKNTKKHNTTNM